jgi:trehalose 6-phosphate phosphatase
MTPKTRATPHLFQAWEPITARVRNAKRVVIFLDFDGTLVRIAPLPSGVRLENQTREILQKLARNRKVTIAMISGRQRSELQQHVNIRKIKYMGLYGWESKGNQRVPFEAREALVRMLVSLLAELPAYPGVWIEPKRNSFSIHLLGAPPETQRRARELVAKSVKPHKAMLKAMSNIRDIEIAPVMLGDKGQAVRKFLDAPAMRGALPFYFGDDFSDEPAFTATRCGVPVLVGKRRATQAKYSVRGPAEVAEALARIDAAIG